MPNNDSWVVKQIYADRKRILAKHRKRYLRWFVYHWLEKYYNYRWLKEFLKK